MSYDSIVEELRVLDDVDLLIILSIGSSRLRLSQIHKNAIALSSMLGLHADAETIAEKLQSSHLDGFIARDNSYYTLTEKGLRAYMLLLEKLKSKSI